jgi:hypothetical protein
LRSFDRVTLQILAAHASIRCCSATRDGIADLIASWQRVVAQ